jgi:hypothetical protein
LLSLCAAHPRRALHALAATIGLNLDAVRHVAARFSQSSAVASAELSAALDGCLRASAVFLAEERELARHRAVLASGLQQPPTTIEKRLSVLPAFVHAHSVSLPYFELLCRLLFKLAPAALSWTAFAIAAQMARTLPPSAPQADTDADADELKRVYFTRALRVLPVDDSGDFAAAAVGVTESALRGTLDRDSDSESGNDEVDTGEPHEVKRDDVSTASERCDARCDALVHSGHLVAAVALRFRAAVRGRSSSSSSASGALDFARAALEHAAALQSHPAPSVLARLFATAMQRSAGGAENESTAARVASAAVFASAPPVSQTLLLRSSIQQLCTQFQLEQEQRLSAQRAPATRSEQAAAAAAPHGGNAASDAARLTAETSDREADMEMDDDQALAALQLASRAQRSDADTFQRLTLTVPSRICVVTNDSQLADEALLFDASAARQFAS